MSALRERLRQALASGFGRGVLALGGGTVLAQVAAMLLAPAIARLYTPEDFGLYATYMTVASLLALLATAKLECVIMLPRRDRQGAALLLLGLCALVTLALGLPLIALGPALADRLGAPALGTLL